MSVLLDALTTELDAASLAIEQLKNDLTVMEQRENQLLAMLTTAQALPGPGDPPSGEEAPAPAQPPGAGAGASTRPAAAKPKPKPKAKPARAKTARTGERRPRGAIRQMILDTLRTANGPMAGGEILRCLAPEGVAESQVYGNLKPLTEDGTVVKVDGKGYELATAGDTGNSNDARRHLPTPPADDEFPPLPGIHQTATGPRYTDDQEKLKTSIYRVLAKGPKDTGAIAANLCRNRRDVEHIISAEINAGRMARTKGTEELAFPDCVKILVNQADLDALIAAA